MILSGQPYSYLQDHTVPPIGWDGVFTVMDARCSLCARGASWIARHDSAEEFKIIPLQSDRGRALMIHFGIDPDDPMSWLYVEEGHAYTSLDAFIRTGMRLGGVWKILFVLRILPSATQDFLYRLVARNRYRWFGKTDLCTLPDPQVQKRLLR